MIFNNIEHSILSANESKDAITAVGNTELCEIVDVEPKSQCKACLTYWDVGIVYCTCGHFLRDDTTGKQEVISRPCWISSSIPELLHQEGAGHMVTGTGRKKGCKEFHTAKQTSKEVSKETIRKTFTIDLSVTRCSERR